jgi:DNA repair protein RecO (recombination protein O)
MPIEKTEGLILRVINFRDTSRILTAYTAERGLVSLLAKGVRGPKPRFGAALELFSVADLVFYHRDSRELQFLSQAMLLDPHLGLGASLPRYAHGSAVLELLLKVLSGQEPPGRVYPLSMRTLEVLETCPLPALPVVFRAFEIKAVSFLGHRPELDACLECGAEVTRDAGFAALRGGVVGPECRGRVDGVMPLSARALVFLRTIMLSPLADLLGEPPPREVLSEAARALESFLGAHLERYEPLRSLRLARALQPDAV